MDDILREAAETIRRLGTAAEDCISCAHSSEGGCSTDGCRYRWKYADRAEKKTEHGPKSREQICSQLRAWEFIARGRFRECEPVRFRR